VNIHSVLSAWAGQGGVSSLDVRGFGGSQFPTRDSRVIYRLLVNGCGNVRTSEFPAACLSSPSEFFRNARPKFSALV
jgi:hypothetical protein